MKFLKNCVRFLIIVLFLPTLCVSHDKKIVIPRSLKIRVLLKEYNTKDNPSFSIATHGGVELQSVPESKKGCVFTRKHINVQVKNNEMYFQEKDSRLGKATKKEIVLIPKKRIITINDITCQGHLILKIDEKKHKLYVINSLDIDDYVYSVLRYESYQSWPLEMQKVQAVVSRTYALHCMMHNKKNAKLPYDVKNNNFHQRYMGVHEYSHLRRAARETKNMVLTYNDEIVLAMFDACCGGVVTAKIDHFNFKQAPYLARKTACEYCKNYKLYSWEAKTTTHKFLAAMQSYPPLKRKLHDLGELRGMKTKDRDKAGLLHKFELQGSRRSVRVSGKEIWMAMGDLFKSKCIRMRKEKEKVFIWGKGYGHHMGLCQRGARELVNKGWDAKKILAFYYPDTKLKTLAVIVKD